RRIKSRTEQFDQRDESAAEYEGIPKGAGVYQSACLTYVRFFYEFVDTGWHVHGVVPRNYVAQLVVRSLGHGTQQIDGPRFVGYPFDQRYEGARHHLLIAHQTIRGKK